MTALAVPESAIYIGCMSGTSLDGLDCVAVRFDDHGPAIEQLAASHDAYPGTLTGDLRRAALEPCDLDEACRLDVRLGRFYGETIGRFVDQSGLPREQIAAIGLHGQTLRHEPDGAPPFTLQIGDAHRVAAETGLRVVADFRRRDLALGGQGAPLTPAFHAWAFRQPGKHRAILNIGGISNLSLLPADDDRPVTGFDCGPGNCLIDHLARELYGQPFDRDGEFAASGQPDLSWVERVLAEEPYFQRPSPKSTGTDYFSPHWLGRHPFRMGASRKERISSVTELTAVSIARAINHSGFCIDELYVCGGGAHNCLLMERLRANLPGIPVSDTGILGLDPQQVEPTAFAWLARQTLLGRPGNLPSVTNARSAAVLGAIFLTSEKMF